MLNALRSAAKGTLAKLLIALLVMSFAVWGVADFVNTVNPTEVARVGDTPVSSREFERVWRMQNARITQQLGRQLSPQEVQAFGLADSVLQSLVSEAVQVDAARDLGVDISDAALAERIRTDPRFAPGGNFDRMAFDRYLANLGYNENEFIGIERQGAIQELWTNSLVGGLNAPNIYLAAVNRFANQTRTVSYFTLGNDAIGTIDDPSEEELRAFYDANQDDFRAPERRSFSIVTLSADELAEPDLVSEDAVRRAYETDGAYGEVERRQVQQIVLDDKEIAENAAQAINDGYAFSSILRQLDRRSADVDLGLITRADIFDPAIAEAAFSLEERKATVVDGRFGPTLIRVSEIQPAQKRPFEEVEGEIRASLALDEAMDQARALQTDVTDAVAGGAPVSEIGERFDLPVQSFSAIDRNGMNQDREEVDIPGAAAVINAAFAADAGSDAVAVDEGDATYWVQVDTVIEADVRPFEEAQLDVLVAWTAAERTERLDAVAEEAVAALEGGEDIAAVAARYGAEVATSDPFTFNAAPEGLPDGVAAEAFEGGTGHAAAVPNGEERIVLEVTDIVEPFFFENDPALSQTRQQLNQGIGTAVLYDLLNAWQTEVGATVNRQIMDQITGVAPAQGRI